MRVHVRGSRIVVESLHASADLPAGHDAQSRVFSVASAYCTPSERESLAQLEDMMRQAGFDGIDGIELREQTKDAPPLKYVRF